jgi:hypothetical protein
MNAAEIIKAIRQPVPWVVAAPNATAVVLRDRRWPALSAEAMRLAARGAVRRRGYAGKTHVGVIMCTGKTLFYRKWSVLSK